MPVKRKIGQDEGAMNPGTGPFTLNGGVDRLGEESVLAHSATHHARAQGG
jgi:hypothetical protein